MTEVNDASSPPEDDARLLIGDPVETLDDHVARGGGQAVARAAELGRDGVLDLLDEANVRGRGGAGFPAGRKWRGVLDTAEATGDDVWFVANGAEGEPGTYKDRTLLAHDPYRMLEGLLVGMRTTGAVGGFVGLKASFTDQVARVVRARDEMIDAGWEGADAIRVIEGPEEYLYGEETAMLKVIEGDLPLPRILKPYERGVFAGASSTNPTVVNNVETLSHVAEVVRRGAEWFRQTGTAESPGSMLFTVLGDVASPGVYELPLGTSLRTLLVDIAGAADIKAVYSGVSNPVIVPAMLDTPLSFEAMNDAGIGMGSGGFMVYDQSRSIVDVLATLVNFLAVESCGQCNACTLGNRAMADLLATIQRGEAQHVDVETLLQRARTVTDQNRCYLPVGSQAMVLSTVAAFEDEFVQTVTGGKPTPADVPTPLIVAIDAATGEVTLKSDYHLKRDDWSYAEG